MNCCIFFIILLGWLIIFLTVTCYGWISPVNFNSSKTIASSLGLKLKKTTLSHQTWEPVHPRNMENMGVAGLKKRAVIKKGQRLQFTLNKEDILSLILYSQVSLFKTFLISLFIIFNIDYFYILTLFYIYTKKIDFYLIKQLVILENLSSQTKIIISKLLIFITISIKYILNLLCLVLKKISDGFEWVLINLYSLWSNFILYTYFSKWFKEFQERKLNYNFIDKLILDSIFFTLKYNFYTIYFLYACLKFCFLFKLLFISRDMIGLLEINFHLNTFLDLNNTDSELGFFNTESQPKTEIQSLDNFNSDISFVNRFMVYIGDLNVYLNNNNYFNSTGKSWIHYLFDSQFEGFAQGNLFSESDNFYLGSDNFENHKLIDSNNSNSETNLTGESPRTKNKRHPNDFEPDSDHNQLWPESILEWAIFIFSYSFFLCGYFYLWASVTGFF